MRLLSVSFSLTVCNVIIIYAEITELQNILQYIVLLSQIITYDLQIFNELQKKTAAVIIFYQNYCDTYITSMSDIQIVTKYFNEKFSLTVQYANNIYDNLILKILLQLTFTALAASEKTIEQIIIVLKTFIIFYARVHNKENLLKENNDAVKDKKDGF